MNKFLIFIFFSFASFSQVDARKEAAQMFKRLSGGVPPSEIELSQMQTLIENNDFEQAAMIAIETSYFYNITAKQFAKAFFDIENSGNIINPLSDGSLTIIGMIKEDVPFNQVLSGDFFYRLGNSTTPFSVENNNHYESAENNFVDISSALQKVPTSTVYPAIDESSAAGIFTTREFAKVYLQDGTNRAAVLAVVNNFFCSSMESVMDNTVGSASLIRRDVTRSPTGGVDVFQSYCMGCHTQMDPLSNAFAYYDYSEREGLTYSPGQIRPKYNINPDNAPKGYQPSNDQWINFYGDALNSSFNFQGTKSGNGPKSLGVALTQSDIFPKCMAKRVFKKVCFHDAKTSSEKTLIDDAANKFSSEYNYSMKNLFKYITATSKCYRN